MRSMWFLWNRWIISILEIYLDICKLECRVQCGYFKKEREKETRERTYAISALTSTHRKAKMLHFSQRQFTTFIITIFRHTSFQAKNSFHTFCMALCFNLNEYYFAKCLTFYELYLEAFEVFLCYKKHF